MTLNERIGQDITAAMKARDAGRLSALRMLKAAVMNRGVEKGRDLDDAEVIQVIGSLVKQRRDAIDQFGKAGRQDLVDKESAEVAVLEEYQPPAASESDIADAVTAAVAEVGATSPKDMGKVMKVVQSRLVGKTVDGRVVSESVKRALAGGA